MAEVQECVILTIVSKRGILALHRSSLSGAVLLRNAAWLWLALTDEKGDSDE